MKKTIEIYDAERNLDLELFLPDDCSAENKKPLFLYFHGLDYGRQAMDVRLFYRDPAGHLDILERYGVTDCVYGHLHGPAIYGAVRGLRGSVRYHQVSCDGLGFKLYLLYP